MKKTVILSLMSLLLASALRTQEHRPTMDVCRADRTAWAADEEERDYFKQETKHMRDGTRNDNPVAKMSFNEINLRAHEMAVCISVDEVNSDKYSEMSDFYMSVIRDRYRNFIERHHLMAQFKAEDAAGIR